MPQNEDNRDKYKGKYSENVTYDWCWSCCQYHRTEAGQPRNTQCKPRPQEGR